MPWWQQKMFVEGINEEFSSPEPQQAADDFDLGGLGFTFQEGQAAVGEDEEGA